MQVAREKWGPQIDTASPICLEYNRPVPKAIVVDAWVMEKVMRLTVF